jgi:hypothetical protein
LLYAGIAFVAGVGVAMFFTRVRLAHMQSMLAGGTIRPGCVTAEAVALLVLAAVMMFLTRS